MTDLATALNQIGVPLAEAARAQAHIESLPSDEAITVLLGCASGLRAVAQQRETGDEKATKDAYRYAAAELYGSRSGGPVEIDTDAVVSIGDEDGAYVQAWVWVSEANLPAEPDSALSDGPAVGANADVVSQARSLITISPACEADLDCMNFDAKLYKRKGEAAIWLCGVHRDADPDAREYDEVL